MSIEDIHQYVQKYNPKFEAFTKTLLKTDSYDYWLGGQIKIKLNTRITDELIRAVERKNEEALNLYGGPCNSFEMYSIQKHNSNFHTLQMLRNEYISHTLYKKNVLIIEKYWLKCITTPTHPICKRRLLCEYEELNNDIQDYINC